MHKNRGRVRPGACRDLREVLRNIGQPRFSYPLRAIALDQAGKLVSHKLLPGFVNRFEPPGAEGMQPGYRLAQREDHLLFLHLLQRRPELVQGLPAKA